MERLIKIIFSVRNKNKIQIENKKVLKIQLLFNLKS